MAGFHQGEPGPQGPAGAVGEPGIGLTGPKVSSVQVLLFTDFTDPLM